jgi:hypothetical protein
MSTDVPKTFLKHLFQTLKAALKQDHEPAVSERDFILRQGMVEGISLIESRINTWAVHQKNETKLKASGQKRLITKEITLSEGRYRKFEWYEGRRFFSLAFRWGKDQPAAEIALQIQNINTLDSDYFTYTGSLDYDTLVNKAKSGGLRRIKKSKTSQEWVVSL